MWILTPEGYDALKQLLDTDEGSKSLGEVALVPYASPISEMGILFYNTLFDENASCHLALESVIRQPFRMEKEMNEEELHQIGGNHSINHVDFMIGTKDMKITGITEDGKEIPVFIDGSWVNYKCRICCNNLKNCKKCEKGLTFLVQVVY